MIFYRYFAELSKVRADWPENHFQNKVLENVLLVIL